MIIAGSTEFGPRRSGTGDPSERRIAGSSPTKGSVKNFHAITTTTEGRKYEARNIHRNRLALAKLRRLRRAATKATASCKATLVKVNTAVAPKDWAYSALFNACL